MNMRVALILLAAALTGVSAPLGAQTVPAKDSQIPDLVEGLVVQAATPGPAWWKVTKGDSTVWILGVPPYISASLKWDKGPLQRRLKGARIFLHPPYLELQPVVHGPGIRTPATYDGMAKPGQTVADLPKATSDRLRADLLRYRAPAPLAKNSIIYVTRNLAQGMFNVAPLSRTAMQTQLSTEAKAARVPVDQVRLSTIPLATAYENGPVGPKLTCLDATMTVAESSANPFAGAIQAWAQGDLPNALATVGCVGVKGEVYRNEVPATLAKLTQYLSRPGKAVAAVELIPLLMQDGVIEQLKAAGYQVDGPEIKETASD